MDLSRAIAKFAKNEILGWNDARQCFEPTGRKGSFAVFDRFITDRTFGTKKRSVLLPRRDYIPSQYEYIRVGDSLARFMVDAINEDAYANTPYANTYLVREAKYRIEIGFWQGEKRASGTGGRKYFAVERVVFGDYERYTANNSSDFSTVDYTVSDIFLPLSVEIDSTKILRVDGKLYEVTEVSRVSNLLWIRAQKLAKDVQPEVSGHRLYECDLVNRWETVDEVLLGGGTYLAEFERPCQTRLIQLGETAYDATEACACVEGSDHFEIALYDSNKTLLAHSDEGSVAWVGEAPGPLFLSIVPLHFEDSTSATLQIGVTPPAGGWGELYGELYGDTSNEECLCNV